MNITKLLILALLCALAAPAHAQERGIKYLTKDGCVLRARAYVDARIPKSDYGCTLEIVRVPKNSFSWDFVLDSDPYDHYTKVDGSITPTAVKRRRQATIGATLYQYDKAEERVTFHNLDLGPLAVSLFKIYGDPNKDTVNRHAATPRYLVLKQPVTITTPTGIAITLPVQGEETLVKMFPNMGGNPDALFIQIDVSPSQHEAVLPQSSLFLKHGKPVTIKLDCAKPDSMVWSTADNTFKTIALELPNLKTVTHLDTLTLIVRQRVDLQALPISLQVPISRSANAR
jgi:hypothetical protein